MNRYRIFLLTIALTLTACASMNSYDVPKTQSQLGQALQKTEGIVQKAQGDFAEKKALLENLRKGGNPAFKDVEADLVTKLKNMDRALTDISASRKEMVEANSDLASLGYNRKEVLAGTREYGLVEEAVKRFERAAGITNSALLDYSRESNSIADLVSQKKLYFNFDVAEFQKRVQKNIGVANDNQKTMTKELTRAENVLNNWNKPEGRDQQEAVFNEMMATTKEYSSKAQRYPELSKAVHTATMGDARISTLDKEWPQVQKLVQEFDRLTGELQGINEKFQNQTDVFRNPSKRVR